MRTEQLIEVLNTTQLDESIKTLYGAMQCERQKERLRALVNRFVATFGHQNVALFSAPGRSEIGGNHTDHQRGRVLAVSVNLDCLALVSKREDMKIELHSTGYDIAPIDLRDCSQREEEKFTSEALLRGLAYYFKEAGYQIGGFQGVCDSNVLKGSGISSSAAFEVLIAKILNDFYNEGKINSIELAKLSQKAENHHFGKPCGLLDQMACAVGGFVYIDFYQDYQPIVEKLDFDFNRHDLHLVLVDTRGSHADLGDEYASLPQEMKQVARCLGKPVLAECSQEELLANIDSIRDELHNDRAILRAMHFFTENERVVKLAESLKQDDVSSFFRHVIDSGRSSYMYNQNVVCVKNPMQQELALALCLSEQILQGKGAWRVHGGGFAGMIQAFVPSFCFDEYITQMEKLFGVGCCYDLRVRPCGVIQIKLD